MRKKKNREQYPAIFCTYEMVNPISSVACFAAHVILGPLLVALEDWFAFGYACSVESPHPRSLHQNFQRSEIFLERPQGTYVTKLQRKDSSHRLGIGMFVSLSQTALILSRVIQLQRLESLRIQKIMLTPTNDVATTFCSALQIQNINLVILIHYAKYPCLKSAIIRPPETTKLLLTRQLFVS